MRSLVWVSLSLIFVIIVVIPAAMAVSSSVQEKYPPMEQPAGSPGNVSGRIMSSDVAIGIPFAHVSIVNADNPSIIYGESTADLAGYYNFSRVNTTWHNGQLKAVYKIFATSGYDYDGYSEAFGVGENVANISCIITNSETTSWLKTYDEPPQGVGYSVHRTKDNGFIIGGSAIMNGNKDDLDFLLIKTDVDGTVQWSRTYGGPDYEKVYSVIQTADGGYIAAGRKGYVDGLYVFRVNENGDQLWGQLISLRYKSGYYIGQRDKDTFFVAGSWQKGAYVAIIDGNGNMLQVIPQDINIKLDSREQYIQPASNGGLNLIGNGVTDGIPQILKVDSSGNVQSVLPYSGPILDKSSTVMQTSDGGYLTGSTDYSGNAYLIRTNAAGAQIWRQNMGSVDSIMSIIKASNDSYIITGSSGGKVFLARVPEKIILLNRTINEGEPYSDIVWTSVKDYGMTRAIIDYGDGTITNLNSVRTIFNIPAHQYNDDGDYSLNVTVTDADSSWRKATVTVNNLAPAKISMSGTATAYNGEPFSRQLTFVDPGNDSWSAYVDYGDGTNASIVAVGRTFSLPAHTYTRNDNYTMKVIVTDDDGASGTGTFLITVTDKPLLDILISPIALVGYVVITAILVMLGIVYRKRKK